MAKVELRLQLPLSAERYTLSTVRYSPALSLSNGRLANLTFETCFSRDADLSAGRRSRPVAEAGVSQKLVSRKMPLNSHLARPKQFRQISVPSEPALSAVEGCSVAKLNPLYLL